MLCTLQQTRRYVGLHHRLDTAASGLLVCAVHRRANRGLAEAFRTHEVQRAYLAVLDGEAEPGIWDRPVGGLAARSTLQMRGTGSGLTAAALTLETGRKHQLRVHAALAGTPICGDRRYGGDAARRWPRLALHAATLALTHPVTGEPCAFQAALPPDLCPLWEEAGG